MQKNTAHHPDLLTAQTVAYELNKHRYTNLKQEHEGKEYSACEFEMNGRSIKFRVAKITPTKIGQFVTLWKRIEKQPIIPFDIADAVDLFVISIRKEERLGQFVFPKSVLHEKGYVSENGCGGKLAMRVYPPWDITNNTQAKKTQSWQLLYFFEILPTFDSTKMQKLFHIQNV